MAIQRGRVKTVSPEVHSLRVLSRADLALLAEKRPVASVKNLRDNHHRIARALASGLTNIEVAANCGITVTRVSQLKQDPALLELVAHYRGMLTADWLKTADPVIEFLGTIRNKSLAMLEAKIDDAMETGEFLPTRDLLGMSELGLDRTGYGKVNKNVNINVDFAANLEAARTRSARARPIEALSPALPQSAPTDNLASSPQSGPSSLRRF